MSCFHLFILNSFSRKTALVYDNNKTVYTENIFTFDQTLVINFKGQNRKGEGNQQIGTTSVKGKHYKGRDKMN